MSGFSDYIRNLFHNDNLHFTITQITQMTGVSGSQLRYWERKGFIKSEQSQKNTNHTYSFKMVLRISSIKYYLDQGYTLKGASAQEKNHRHMAKIYHQFLDDHEFEIAKGDNGEDIVVLGTLDEDPKAQIYMTMADHQAHLHLRHLP